MGAYVIGIDAGGTMTKAALFDLKGNELACARSRNVMVFSKPSWTERDADAMWRAAASAVREVLETSGTAPGDILGVSLSGYGSGLYLLDRGGNPVRPGIVSTDGRAVSIVNRWYDDGRGAEIEGMIQQRLWWAQSLVLLGWLQENEPEVLDRTYRVSFCKDFLRGRLCGDLSTDFSDAGAAGLLDCASRTYAIDALKLAGLDAWIPKLPDLGPSEETVGGVTKAAAELTGLLEGTPVVRGVVDMGASAMASRVTRSEEMSIVAGTFSIATTLHAEKPKTDAMPILQFPYPLGGWLAVEASPTSASNLEWVVRTVLAQGGEDADLDALYERVNAAVQRHAGRPFDTMFFPYLYGSPDGAPAGFLGMNAQTGFDETMAAVFEGIVFAHKNDIDTVLTGPDAAHPQVIRLSGGASRSAIWSEMFADILNLPVEVPVGSEFGALGTAICAAAATGGHASLPEAVEAMTGIARRHEVHPDRGDLHRAKYPRYRALSAALAGCEEMAHA